MNCGILRIKSFTAGAISHIGGEEDRLHKNEKNPDIDMSRAHLNQIAIRDEETPLQRAWKEKISELSVDIKRKNQIVMEQAIVTASPDFFKELGWDKEAAKDWTPQDIPDGIMDYFSSSIEWAADYFGQDNILSATIHFDETTPHMHIDYIPVVEASKRRKDVYQKDADGKIVKDDKGHAVRARDEAGKVIYDYVDAPARLSRSDYWQQRGGRQSYRRMQDQFFEQVSSRYGLDRGEIGTGRQHIEQERHKAAQARQTAQEQMQVAQAAEQTRQAAEIAAKQAQEQIQAAEMAAQKYEGVIRDVQAAGNAGKIYVGEIGKTLMGKRTLTPDQVNKVEKMQAAITFRERQLQRKEDEIAEKDRDINRLKAYIGAQSLQHMHDEQRNLDIERKAEQWDRLKKSVPHIKDAAVRKSVTAVIEAIQQPDRDQEIEK